MSEDGTSGGRRDQSVGFTDLTRRLFLAAGAALGVGATASGAGATSHSPRGRGPGRGRGQPLDVSGDLVLVNGKIHTMDDDGSVVSAVSIRDGRFESVGNGVRARGPDTTVVNLHGQTVVPGIVDNHNHFVLLGLRPGYHTPLENASSIGAVHDTLAARRPDVPAGEFITAIGGFHPNQFEEDRLPTLDELDAAVDDRPVYLQVSFSGPSTTNTLGKAFFEGEGVTVGTDGAIESGEETGLALLSLREAQTFEDKLRGTRDAMAYSTSLGVTTHLDQGAFPATGTPSDGAAHEDLFTMHDPCLHLHRQGELDVRLQVNFLNLETDEDVPMLRERLKNAFQLFGDDKMNTGGIGEFTAGTFFELFVGPPSEAWKNGTELVAEEGWRNENHSLTGDDYEKIVDYWEVVHAEHDISDLRWVLAHVPFITREYVNKLDALGAGHSLTGWRYLAGTGENNGPPFRMILDNANRVGMSSDSAQIAPLNPWLHMYYAVTGRNANGDLINDGQQITREEVLRLYTAENAWFLHDDRLGSIEPGNHADLVVLSDDYFAVDEEAIKDIRSELTVVDGHVVHDAGTVG